MPNLFPIGSVSSGSSKGTIDGKSYDFLEPNNGCLSVSSGNILTHTFEEKTIQTRKKSEPTLTIKYSFENILNREYKQIEHFVESVAEDGLNPFMVVSIDRGETPASVTASGGTTWVTTISNTRYYSLYEKQKAYFAFVTDGDKWKLGKILAVGANTKIHIDVSASTYGSLSATNANTDGNVYPVYSCYMPPKQLQSGMNKTVFISGDVNATSDAGFMYAGDIHFTSQYKV